MKYLKKISKTILTALFKEHCQKMNIFSKSENFTLYECKADLRSVLLNSHLILYTRC